MNTSLFALTIGLSLTATTLAAANAALPEAARDTSSEDALSETGRDKQEPSRVGVFIEPLFVPFGFLEGEVMVGVSDNVAVGVSGQYFAFDIDIVGVQLGGVALQAQIFPLKNGKTFDGFYVTPAIKYQNVEFVGRSDDGAGNSQEGTANVTYIGPQIVVGYQWDWQPFSLRLGGGVEYAFGRLSADFTDQSVDFQGVGLETDIALGLTF